MFHEKMKSFAKFFGIFGSIVTITIGNFILYEFLDVLGVLLGSLLAVFVIPCIACCLYAYGEKLQQNERIAKSLKEIAKALNGRGR
ncbi:MAG: hypothetical protein FWG82_05045 [Oscillospiraceae bacterium]|nr:hypothetical protein [Oscillospiraceae bacterium]